MDSSIIAIDEYTNCNNQAALEEYADFIVNYGSPPQDVVGFFNGTCYQTIGLEESVVYSPLSSVIGRLNNGRFPYMSIPNLFSMPFEPFDSVGSEDIRIALERSGITQVQRQPTLMLKGRGTIIGIVCDGVDYQDELFRNSDGTTRIKAIWDMTNNIGTKPMDISYGTEWTEADINESLENGTNLGVEGYGYGTELLKVACGYRNTDRLEDTYIGAAPEASIVVVKLKEAKQYLKTYYGVYDDRKAYQENDIILAISYILTIARNNDSPASLLVPLSTSNGGHGRSTIINVFLEKTAERFSVGLVTSTGDEGNKRQHFRGSLSDNVEDGYTNVELKVGKENGIYLEIWSNAPEILTVGLVSPAGEIIERVSIGSAFSSYNLVLDNSVVTIEYRQVSGDNINQLTIIRIVRPSEGIWNIRVYGTYIYDGRYDIWLPEWKLVGPDTYFLRPDPEVTLSDISCVSNAISVSSYFYNTGIAPWSGRGFTRTGRIKPDICSLVVDNSGGGTYGSALAIAAGAVDLVLEWAQVKKNSVYIKNSDIKRILINGAIRDRDETYPSKTYGYGKLNLYDAFGNLR